MVVAADAGMLSGSNLKALDELGLSFIVGSRATKAPGDLGSHFHWNGDVFTDGQIIDTVTPRHGNTKVNDTELRAEPVWDPEPIPVRGGRSGPIRPNAPAATRKHWPRSKPAPGRSWPAKRKPSRHDSSNPRHRPQPGRGQPGPRAFPGRPQRLRHQRAGHGHAGRRSHREVPRPVARRKVISYVQERLRARPMFHYTRDAIEAHLTIVFTALAVSHAIQQRTGLAIGKVVKQLRPLRSATITINGTTQTFPPEIPEPSRKFSPISASSRGTKQNVRSQVSPGSNESAGRINSAKTRPW